MPCASNMAHYHLLRIGETHPRQRDGPWVQMICSRDPHCVPPIYPGSSAPDKDELTDSMIRSYATPALPA